MDHWIHTKLNLLERLECYFIFGPNQTIFSRNQEQPKNLSTLQSLISANDREKFEMEGRNEILDELKGNFAT